MPFEIPQREPQVEVGPFQKLADAMLLGCALTRPGGCLVMDDRSCALGALGTAMGIERDFNAMVGFIVQGDCAVMRQAYRARYGVSIEHDNDDDRHTREQIAARIAALR